jgi:hypothetical protein
VAGLASRPEPRNQRFRGAHGRATRKIGNLASALKAIRISGLATFRAWFRFARVLG